MKLKERKKRLGGSGRDGCEWSEDMTFCYVTPTEIYKTVLVPVSERVRIAVPKKIKIRREENDEESSN